jgi:cysteinyl-tRNA synthetase
MQNNLVLYNTLTRQKEKFEPINPPFVGLYVCGPTVYGEPHLGHARSAMTFDIVNRYLTHLGYKVRYVRNITDVGHLTDDVAGTGEDKIEKRAKLEKLEPMEIVEHYTQSYHQGMDALNIKRPSIEPRASGHIVEQIEMIEEILKHGFAYEVNGSIYFDVKKYNETGHYGKLSGRIIEDLLSGTRELDGQEEKRSPLDFALWKKASEDHLMRWPSPWSDGFPGWHLECSAMSSKYLGQQFDIHGGGMDLMFPHHECEIAQTKAACGKDAVKYWMHNNMITINGQKMGKSLNNFINLKEFFDGSHSALTQSFSPMSIRFFILQAHYRSTLDFSNDALIAASKGFKRIINGLKTLKALQFVDDGSAEKNQQLIDEINVQIKSSFDGLDDDFNTAMAIAGLFNLLKKINSLHTGQIKFGAVGEEGFKKLKDNYIALTEDILGLREEKPANTDKMLDIILSVYQQAKNNKDYDKVDWVRKELKQLGIVVKDMKTGIDWSYEE